jgi:hypothetical protein
MGLLKWWLLALDAASLESRVQFLCLAPDREKFLPLVLSWLKDTTVDLFSNEPLSTKASPIKSSLNPRTAHCGFP